MQRDTNEYRDVLRTSLAEISPLPYNTIAAAFDALSIPNDPFVWGTDCIGKLDMMMQRTQDRNPVLLRTMTRAAGIIKGTDIVHFSMVSNGYYLDPFLFQQEPISLHQVAEEGAVVVPSLEINHEIAAISTNEGFKVEFRKSSRPGNPLIVYEYGPKSEFNGLPNPLEVINLNTPYKFMFLDQSGRLYTLRYNMRDHNFICNSQAPLECEFPDLILQTESKLQAKYGISMNQLIEYFREGNSCMQYIRYWKEHAEV